MKACPFCAEEIQDAAIKCKHCGSLLIESASYRDESPFGVFAIGLYLLFLVGVAAVSQLGELAVAVMLTNAIVWSILAFSLGKKKGRPVRSALLGMALGPLGLLVVALQD